MKNVELKEVLEEGTMVVLTEEIQSCGCSVAEIGTVGKIEVGKPDRDEDYRVAICKDDCFVYAKAHQFTICEGKEVVKAENLFANASEYRYAKFN